MMVVLKFVLTLSVWALVNGQDNGYLQSPLIEPILQYLNSNPNKVYDYTSGTVLNAENKADIIEVSAEINVFCNYNFPDIPCNERQLICHGYLGHDATQNGLYHVLSDVRCSPKVEVVVDEEIPRPATSFYAEQNGKLDLSNEALQPDQGQADFVAYQKSKFPCLGCPFDLNPNAEGVDELLTTALKHIESERGQRHVVLSIKKLQRQVVAGLKFILVAEIASTTCPKDADLSAPCPLDSSEPLLCEIHFVQKPWISRSKHVIKNNCTASQEFEPVSKDISNEILPYKNDDADKSSKKPDYDNIAVNGMADLESQIIPDHGFVGEAYLPPPSVSRNLNSQPKDNDRRTLFASMPVVDEIEPIVFMYDPYVDYYSEANEFHWPNERMARDLDGKNDSSSDGKSSSSSHENGAKSQKLKKDESSKSSESDEKKSDSSSSEERKTRPKRSVGQMEHILPEEKFVVRDVADFAVAQMDGTDADHQRTVILQILGAKKLVLDGVYFQIIMRLGTSYCDESDFREECREKLLTDLTRICKVQVWVDDDYSNPKVVKNRCQQVKKIDFDENRTYRRSKRSVPNFHLVNNITDDEIINKALVHLSSKVDQTTPTYFEHVATLSSILIDQSHFHSIHAKIRRCSGDTFSSIHCSEPVLCHFRFFNGLEYKQSGRILIRCDPDTKLHAPIGALHDILIGDKLRGAFEKFSSLYGKVYKTSREWQYRLGVFESNLQQIDDLNKGEMGTAVYGITEFSDMSWKEFSKSRGYKGEVGDERVQLQWGKIPDVAAPVEFDWRAKGAVTKVKNQGQCGSCWAFSVTGNVEGQYAIKHGKLLEFSEQELVDCDKSDDGCDGGLMDNAYKAIEKLGGLESETDYPYDADDESCKFNPAKVEVRLTGAVNISHNETDMAKWLAVNGPISIAINANAMQFYFGGVSHPFKFLCSPKSLDHGVLIVGYGVDKFSYLKKQLPYWIVKNSWGTSWGEQGYYRVYRGDGTCGLNQTPSSAIIE